MRQYNPQKIESKRQKAWSKDNLYRTGDDRKKPKYYILDMFPYPSGAGLHVGHPKGYIATDIFARMKMMQGFNVLHPMGWDAFGLPAENFALKNKTHPRKMNEKNIATFKGQLEKIGFTYDWEREINTTDPDYYKWTQWTFLQMFKKGLAYESYEPINWCPDCKTGLANEDLEDGLCERCGSEIEQKPMRQWVIKITDYADRMLKDLEKLPEWPEPIKEMQRNWIGRSEGAVVNFKVKSSKLKVDEVIKVFTTRVDTIFGCTYVVIAPEHDLISNLKSQITNLNEVRKYVEESRKKTEMERTELQKEKTGVELNGIKAVNPFNGEEVPVFVADYVLGNYGTGAVMAVPAHDERDFDFAKKYSLPIKESVAPYWKNDPREDKETEKREVATAIIRNPKDNTYLCLDWKTTEWRSFPTGGIEGDDPIVAAMREVREETGYKNLKFIKQIGDSIFAEFYRPHKESNVFAHFKYFLFELEDEDKDEVDQKEKNQHEALWIKEENIENFINVWNQKLTWRRYREGDFAYCEDGVLINSEKYDGLFSAEAREKMTTWLEKNNLGKSKVNYKLKDWVFSRQRYWGEPIPIVHCEKCGAQGVPEKDLPITLPEVKSYEPTGTGESPLANIDEWVNTKCPKCEGPAKRETNTMPQWAGSSWYYLRYIDPKNDEVLVDKEKEKYWSPVDFYVGGAEHATRHLIYARFWHKFLFDIGAVNYEEPFTRLQNVGLIMAEDGRKMSKRWGNVINPDDIVKDFGADSLRMYEMFMGPFSQSCAWSTSGLAGTRKFLDRVWRIFQEKEMVDCGGGGCVGVPKELPPLLHKTIKKVTEDIQSFSFNTAVSQMMIFINEAMRHDSLPKSAMERFLKLLAPFAPHIAEEIWVEVLKKEKSIFLEEWPKFNPDKIQDERVELVIQVNGKVRDRLNVSFDISEEDAKNEVLKSEKVQKFIEGKEIKKVIFVKGKLISIVI